MSLKTKIILLFIFFITSMVFSEIRYVSKTGSHLPPFTSWETASNFIQEAVDSSSFGDTIYVGAGIYKEMVTLNRGISLIGGGIDSTIIDISEISVSGFCIEMLDRSFVSNLSCISGKVISHTQGAIQLVDLEMNSIYATITNIKTSGGIYNSILGSNFNGKIQNSIITNTSYGIYIDSPARQLTAIYENNYINVEETGITSMLIGPKTVVRHNIITGNKYNMFGGFFSDSTWIYNNLFYNTVYNSYQAIIVGDLTYIYNNVIYSVPGVLLKRGITIFNNNQYVYNNIIVGTKYGIESRNGGVNTNIKYNNFWKTEQDFNNFPLTPGNTNMHVNPMFIDIEGMDVHLQRYSPMIDAGDPEVLDVDGSRSDLGMYGGPHGESYRYQDIAPVKPQSLVHDVTDSLVILNWELNTEADFSHYQVDIYYDDIHSGGVNNLDSARFEDILPNGIDKALYTIISTDNHGNESDTTSFSISLVNMKAKHEDTHGFRLNHNYPNPFNPKTNISFYIEESSRARVSIYNSNGELIDEIFNRAVERGYYSVPYTPEVASGIYLYRLEVRQNNVIIFADMGKMVYLK